MKERVFVLNVSRFDFEDKDSGRRIVGCKVQYFGQMLNGDNKKGQEVVTITTNDLTIYSKFSELPAFYDLSFAIVPTTKGAQIRLTGAEFAHKVDDAKFVKAV